MRKIGLAKPLFLLIIFLLPSAYARERAYFDREILRDPFNEPEGFVGVDGQSRVLFEKMLLDMKIMGIIIDGNKKYAIINDSIVKEKEIWKELLIDEIDKDRLVVIYRGLSTIIPYREGAQN